MLTSSTLRIDRGNGSPIIDYRIQDGRVESRILDSTSIDSETGWQQVTPEQLCSHVMSSSIVAQWLRRRMGLYALLRACNHKVALPDDAAPQYTEHTAA